MQPWSVGHIDQAAAHVVRVVSAGYQGPGDVVSGALWWVGLRGYTAALSDGTHAAIDVVDQANANPLTGVKILSTGALDVASIAAWVTANSVTTIKITKLYDQTGNGFHLTNLKGFSTSPILTLSAFGSLPGITFDGSSFTLGKLTSFTTTQSITISTVYNQNGAGGGNCIFADNGAIELDGGTNQVIMNAGTNFPATATQGTTHAIQAIINNASSSFQIDGSQTTGTAGANAPSGNDLWLGSYNGLSFFWPGKIAEFGEWHTTFTGGQISSMNSQQHSYWGF